MKPVKWQSEISKYEVVVPCKHEDVEYEYDYEDGYPYVVGALCLDCDTDITDSLSEADIMRASEDEAENIISRQIDSAIGFDQDQRAGLL